MSILQWGVTRTVQTLTADQPERTPKFNYELKKKKQTHTTPKNKDQTITELHLSTCHHKDSCPTLQR
uniref:hypothetical protein n=1 Tax=Cronobacter dublinensis TaxID=413497 RepID=UPI001F41CF6F